MWNLWIRPPKRGGNDCLRYAISWLNKKCYKDITNYFSCNMNLMNQKNYCQAITKIHGILKLWRMRNFFIEGKILVFTTLAISKLVYLVLLTVAPDHIIDEKVARIQKWFIPHNWFSIKKDFNDNGYQKSLWFIRSYFCHFCIEKIGFGNNLVSWIKTLITKQESCIISNGNTTQYFHLERRACQGDPISTCIFILALKVLSFLFRSNKDIKCLTIFDHLFLYTGYADDSFFFENRKSTKKLVETFALFFSFLSLKAGISNVKSMDWTPMMYVLSFSVFSVLGLKNYMMIVFVNGRQFIYIYLANILAFPLNSILTFILKVKFWKTFHPFYKQMLKNCKNILLHFL